MDTKKSLEAQRRVIMNKLSVIENRESREAAKPLVGKCFKYLNSYGHGKQWWLYLAVLSYDQYGHLRTLEFQRDCNGRVDVRPNETERCHIGTDDDYIAITRKEFDRQWKQALRYLQDLSTKYASREGRG